MPKRRKDLDGRRQVHTRSTHDRVYGLFSKAGKLFYIGRTGQSLADRFYWHQYMAEREKQIGRVKNPVLTVKVLRKGAHIRELSPLLERELAKQVELNLIKNLVPSANIRNTGRKATRGTVTDEIRAIVLSNPDTPCEQLAVDLGLAACTISTIRKKARK